MIWWLYGNYLSQSNSNPAIITYELTSSTQSTQNAPVYCLIYRFIVTYYLYFVILNKYCNQVLLQEVDTPF